LLDLDLAPQAPCDETLEVIRSPRGLQQLDPVNLLFAAQDRSAVREDRHRAAEVHLLRADLDLDFLQVPGEDDERVFVGLPQAAQFETQPLVRPAKGLREVGLVRDADAREGLEVEILACGNRRADEVRPAFPEAVEEQAELARERFSPRAREKRADACGVEVEVVALAGILDGLEPGGPESLQFRGRLTGECVDALFLAGLDVVLAPVGLDAQAQDVRGVENGAGPRGLGERPGGDGDRAGPLARREEDRSPDRVGSM